ncbi:hypothetical protein K9N68_19995 [Kovacikia minuta CCNUW1]|uniref:hypothetical protein n=1 Tax=Kovacikia minuta TaxID=2931930 RepID=UPI001CCE3DF8|nr:hypothetical protein [Kovacikia minuta]UBF24004.1 hypothetical protein K9N68_19995 [Kovacikia minuta CCNUW1]
MVSLVDIGVNLTHAAFDIDRQQVIERAIAAGVHMMILTGATVEERITYIEQVYLFQ